MHKIITKKFTKKKNKVENTVFIRINGKKTLKISLTTIHNKYPYRIRLRILPLYVTGQRHYRRGQEDGPAHGQAQPIGSGTKLCITNYYNFAFSYIPSFR